MASPLAMENSRSQDMTRCQKRDGGAGPSGACVRHPLACELPLIGSYHHDAILACDPLHSTPRAVLSQQTYRGSARRRSVSERMMRSGLMAEPGGRPSPWVSIQIA